MKEYGISDEIRKTLMESAAWGRVGMAPEFLNEDDDGEEAPAEEAPAEEAPAEEAPAEEADDDEAAEEDADEGEEEITEEGVDRAELLNTLLQEMSDDELLDHIESVMSAVDQASKESIVEDDEELEA